MGMILKLRGDISATEEEYLGFKTLMEEDEYLRAVGPKPISRIEPEVHA